MRLRCFDQWVWKAQPADLAIFLDSTQNANLLHADVLPSGEWGKDAWGETSIDTEEVLLLNIHLIHA